MKLKRISYAIALLLHSRISNRFSQSKYTIIIVLEGAIEKYISEEISSLSISQFLTDIYI